MVVQIDVSYYIKYCSILYGPPHRHYLRYRDKSYFFAGITLVGPGHLFSSATKKAFKSKQSPPHNTHRVLSDLLACES